MAAGLANNKSCFKKMVAQLHVKQNGLMDYVNPDTKRTFIRMQFLSMTLLLPMGCSLKCHDTRHKDQ
jgi:hypothetical protein